MIWLTDKDERRDSDHWLIVGTAPGTLQHVKNALYKYPKPKVFGCNQGLRVVENPHVLLQTDTRIIDVFSEKRARARADGTQVLIHPSIQFDIKWDLIVDYHFNRQTEPKLEMGYRGIAHGRQGAVIGAQWLIVNGVKHIHFAGCSQYTSEPTAFSDEDGEQTIVYEDGLPVLNFLAHTIFEKVLALYSDVQFYCHGPKGSVFKDLERVAQC